MSSPGRPPSSHEELESCVANALFAARDSPSWSYRYEPAGRRKEEVLSVQEPASSSTSTKPFVASAFTGHDEYDDIVNQSRRIAGDFGHISPGEKEMTVQVGPKQPDNNNNNTAGTSPMADLGAQTSCGTLAGASLLPAVIAKALNSRATNASSCSHTCNNLNFRTSTPSAIASLLPLTCSKTGNMGYNVNRFKGGARTRRSESSGQSQKAHCALVQVPVTGNTTRNEQLPMTNQPVSNSVLGRFNPDAYGKPNKMRGNFQGHTGRQQSATFPAPPAEVSRPNHDLPPVNDVNGVDEVPVSPRGDIGGIDPEGNGSAVQPENRSVRYDPNFTAAQDKSLTNMNDGSESAARRKENNRMKENAKPGKADALSTPANNAQETQVQKLERLRTQEITKVGNRIRQQSGEPTTSPEALNLARQAGTKLQAAETTPEIRKTTTIELSPTIIAQMNGPGNGTAPLDVSEAQAKTQDSRRGPINRFGRSATLNTRGKRGGRSNNVRKSHWATASEVKPPQAPPKSIDSNAFGSEVPSDAETASGDSVAAMNNGRLLRKNRTDGPDAPLADWSGNWMPPPADWDGRPRFNNNSAEFIGEFGQWNEITALQSLNVATGIPFTRLSKDLVENPDLHPDGLDLVDPTISVDVDTAERYGYSEDALLIIRRDAQLIDPEIFLQDWGKLDLRLPDNLKFKDERCEDLVRNYNANIAKEREEEISLRRAQKLARRHEGPIISEPNPHTPRINIYLRPAVRSDIPQLQEIYNYYVKNSVRTAEIHPITYSEMLDRWADSTDEKLPFLVAVSKSAKINRDAGNAIEKVVGWASATDWVSRHAVERFTVELEIYVHQRHLHQGVGKCLMDKLIDSTDRGHIARKGYPFTCATEVRHGYSAGGARDLIKLLIIVRSFDKIRTPKENDLPWIKKWLEDEWKFEQQGYFPKAGVKFKRYVNQTYFVRSTSYNPKELMIPEENP